MSINDIIIAVIDDDDDNDYDDHHDHHSHHHHVCAATIPVIGRHQLQSTSAEPVRWLTRYA